MNRPSITRSLAAIAAAVLVGPLFSAAASAEDRRGERHEQGASHERRETREVYQARHWVYDNRYHHGHYYPTLGYSVSVLPPGNIGVNFGRGRFFFHGGAWYRPGPAGFVVVRPPIGIVVPMLPLGYSTLWVNDQAYYYANDVYYGGGPGNYVVVAPPTSDNVTLSQPPAAQTPAPQAPGNWYYCESAKAYYPYVKECREGWRPVPANPPGAN